MWAGKINCESTWLGLNLVNGIFFPTVNFNICGRKPFITHLSSHESSALSNRDVFRKWSYLLSSVLTVNSFSLPQITSSVWMSLLHVISKCSSFSIGVMSFPTWSGFNLLVGMHNSERLPQCCNIAGGLEDQITWWGKDNHQFCFQSWYAHAL